MAKRGLSDKCRKCAMLSAEQAQVLHGAEGDGCWNPAVCYSRRSYARNRARVSQTRSRKRKESELEQIPVQFEPLSQLVFGVLVVYRKAGTDTPVHAIAAQIWQGQEKVAIVPPVHCIGMVPSQVHTYVGKMLDVLETRYGIKKFVGQTRLDPDLCELRPCPLHE
ncbi:hypothetical protein H6F93_15645 [Leptolyngbya sp. FACHB-671]|uniref:hypothetical protein n=1 Tax=Leptolyngbya sp. FACHB-671 TaxID=2692812 RepID=UPI00168444DF|nr:hypothetical protein [Leptolyngbya sp. FACHB-671]MBD1869013.1 hypothetical protein [Cyanobacteria bacterium FACHB-471]MBD2068937.1 hypothetical protein [Leptolyngbya sp. FACHB-671]